MQDASATALLVFAPAPPALPKVGVLTGRADPDGPLQVAANTGEWFGPEIAFWDCIAARQDTARASIEDREGAFVSR
jgi:hypothetical protein